MRLSGREDIDLGIEEAFAALTDVAFLERQLLRRGIDVVRTDALELPGVGAAWRAEADWAGRRYPLAIEATEWVAPSAVTLVARSGGLSGILRPELTALSRSQTRIRVTLDVKGAGFRDRMLLNSVALAKSRLSQKFSDVVTTFARDVETRAARA